MGHFQETPVTDLGGGLNQSDPSSKIPIRECLELENMRVPRNGTTKMKRPGLSKVDSLYSFGTKSIYGGFGIVVEDETKLLACLEDDIQLKYGGAWNSVFTPTDEIDRPVSIAKDKGLTFIAGYEKLITIKGNDAFYSGIEAPDTGPTLAAGAAASGVSELKHGTSHQDNIGELRQNAARTLLSQSFKVDDALAVSKITLRLKKIGSPSGNIWVEIHSSQAGTSGTKDASTNIVGEASDNVAASGVGAAFASHDFDFSGTEPPLSADTTYYFVVYGSFTVSAAAHVIVGLDSGSPSYSKGKYFEVSGSFVWTEQDSVDLVFELYAESTSSGEVLAFGAMDTGTSNDLRDGTARAMLAQSFEVDSATDLSSIKLPLSKYCAPLSGNCTEGNLWVEIHSSTAGTSATKNASANIVGQASDNVDIENNLLESKEWIEFTFSGTAPSLTASTTYYIVLYGTYAYHSLYHVKWTLTTGYADGTAYAVTSTFTWNSVAYDHSFKLYGTTTGDAKQEEYAFTNQDVFYELRQNAATTLMAQEFIAPKSGTVYSVKLYLSKLGAPAGNVWAEIHSLQSGTSASKGASTNMVTNGDSANVAISGLNAMGTYAEHEFVFSTPPTLVQNNTYYLVVYASYTISATVCVFVGQDKLEAAFVGKRWELDASLAWTAVDHVDLIFDILYTPGDLVGDFKYVVTFYRGGNYPCESNPCEEADAVTVAAGEQINLTAIPVSSESEVTKRRLYRTKTNLAIYYWLDDIDDNTTTTFTDATPDDSLGDEVNWASYVPRAFTRIANWDNRLWGAGAPDYEEDLFRSGNGTPEQFDTTAASRIILREKETDYVKEIIEFKNNLYALKRKCIWMVTRSGASSYIVDTVVENTGTATGDSVAVCFDGKYLIFLSSHYRIEVFDGMNIITPPDLPDKVKDTLDDINKDYLHKVSGVDNPARGEYHLSIPTGSNQDCDTTIIFDYERFNFYVDKYHKNIASVNLMDITEAEREVVYGTSSGGFFKFDKDATLDDDQIIAGSFRTGWRSDTNWRVLRRMFIDFRLPEDKIMVFKIYKDFEENAEVVINIDGNTPTGGGSSLRDIIHYKTGLYVPGSSLSFEFIHAEDAGGDWEVIGFTLFHRGQRHKASVSAAT